MLHLCNFTAIILCIQNRGSVSLLQGTEPIWNLETMEDEDESISNSGDSAGSEPDYDVSPESNGSDCDTEDEQIPPPRSAPPPNLRRKSQNVAALVRFVSC